MFPLNPLEVHYKDSFAALKIGNLLSNYMNNVAIVCIGTDKCIVDSLGPLTGTLLTKENIYVDIYGTLEKPVHGMNLDSYIKKIKNKKYDCVIALDACLSKSKNQGVIEVRGGPIRPGKGVGKLLPEIGDISIMGIVDSSDKEFHDLVQHTRLSLIYEMAEIISQGIINACNMNISSQYSNKLSRSLSK